VRIREASDHLSNSEIYVYGGQAEHPPPHCHLLGPHSRCSINLATLEVTKGHYGRTDLREAIDWLSDANNNALVLKEWRRLNERE
jgi:hypothetical protein